MIAVLCNLPFEYCLKWLYQSLVTNDVLVCLPSRWRKELLPVRWCRLPNGYGLMVPWLKRPGAFSSSWRDKGEVQMEGGPIAAFVPCLVASAACTLQTIQHSLATHRPSCSVESTAFWCRRSHCRLACLELWPFALPSSTDWKAGKGILVTHFFSMGPFSPQSHKGTLGWKGFMCLFKASCASAFTAVSALKWFCFSLYPALLEDITLLIYLR